MAKLMTQKIQRKAGIRAEKAGKTAEILIYDQIGKDWFGDGVSAEEFNKQLSAIEADTLSVRINSPGGNVFEGVAIYNALKRFPGTVEVHVDALAASIASVIAMAGDTIHMGEGSYMMIHNPWSIVMGTAEDMRKEAQLLDKITGSIVAIYAGKSDADMEEIERLMTEETWMTAEEAVDLGFADSKEKAKEVNAGADLSRFGFRNIPHALLVGADAKIPSRREMERTLMQDAGLSRSQARAMLSNGYNALSGTQDATKEGDQALQAVIDDMRAAIAIIKP